MKILTTKITAFIFILFVAGCTQLAQMASQYALSEPMVNRYMQGYLGQAMNINASGLANASLTFNQLNADIGREDPNRVTLSGKALFGLSSLLGNQSANVDMKVRARPIFDNAKGAVFLKDLEVSDLNLESGLGSVGASALLPYLNTAIQYYFDQQPVYILDPNNPLESMALKMGTNVEIQEGRLVFPFGAK